MRQKLLYSAAILLVASLTSRGNASTYQFSFVGSGVNGTIALAYGTGTDTKYPQAFEVTGISGTFTDSNLGIVSAAITGLEPINHALPEPTNLLAPNDFSKYTVALGTMDGSLSYDDLYYPSGSPQTASDYPFHGGFLDIYGVLFDISGGDVVNLWSNGVLPGTTFPDYGVAVATHATTLDYVGGVVAPTPEPSSLCMLATGLLALLFWQGPSFLRMQG